jgi:hypothetical protein
LESMNFPGKTATAGMDQRYKPLHYALLPVEDRPGQQVMETRWIPTELEIGYMLNGAPVSVHQFFLGSIPPMSVLVNEEVIQARTDRPTFGFSYRNYRGELSWRNTRPLSVWWGRTEWHPEDQWLLRALDTDKNQVRDFAMKDILPVDDLSRKVEAWVKRVMPLLNQMAGDGLVVDGQEDPIDLWNAGYNLFQLPSVITLQGDIDQAVQTATLRPAVDADRARELLYDLVSLLHEEQAIGGGPGFKDRYAKTLADAVEALGLEG